MKSPGVPGTGIGLNKKTSVQSIDSAEAEDILERADTGLKSQTKVKDQEKVKDQDAANSGFIKLQKAKSGAPKKKGTSRDRDGKEDATTIDPARVALE